MIKWDLMVRKSSRRAASIPYKWGEKWNSYSLVMKMGYAQGFKDGVLHGALGIMARAELLGKSPDLALKVSIETEVNAVLLATWMTHFYGDPANAYIHPTRMIYIARDKIKGRLVELKLLEERRQAQIEIKALKSFEDKQ